MSEMEILENKGNSPNCRASSGASERNVGGTRKRNGTQLTQPCSRSVPEPQSAITVLKKLRSKHGFDSQIGRRCSNILELMDQCPRPPSEWIDYLMPDHVPMHYEATRQRIALQTADLHGLLAS